MYFYGGCIFFLCYKWPEEHSLTFVDFQWKFADLIAADSETDLHSNKHHEERQWKRHGNGIQTLRSKGSFNPWVGSHHLESFRSWRTLIWSPQVKVRVSRIVFFFGRGGGGDFDTLDFWLAKNGEHGENHLLLATSGAPMTKKP